MYARYLAISGAGSQFESSGKEGIDPAVHHGKQQIFFGATVTYLEADGARHRLTILGIDEVDSSQAQVSWVSSIARTLLKAHSGDVLQLLTPAGKVETEVGVVELVGGVDWKTSWSVSLKDW
jgi:transcription elongation GreA/GreB family factor